MNAVAWEVSASMLNRVANPRHCLVWAKCRSTKLRPLKDSAWNAGGLPPEEPRLDRARISLDFCGTAVRMPRREGILRVCGPAGVRLDPSAASGRVRGRPGPIRRLGFHPGPRQAWPRQGVTRRSARPPAACLCRQRPRAAWTKVRLGSGRRRAHQAPAGPRCPDSCDSNEPLWAGRGGWCWSRDGGIHRNRPVDVLDGVALGQDLGQYRFPDAGGASTSSATGRTSPGAGPAI